MADRKRLLAIIGSGETASRMARVQRDIVARLSAAAPAGTGDGRPRAVVIDSPYAFQMNAAATSAMLVDFHTRRLGLPTVVASLRAGAQATANAADARRVREADYVFSGPGSPSHALRHWVGSALPGLLGEKLERGGAIVFASAAALTLGRVTLPVYEIYKVGEDPHWLPGLDVLGAIGINAAVIPHFDNSEGAGHDTRYCFVGEQRLRMLEEQLPPDTFILGVDEHTALVLDLGEDRARVEGRGAVTVRRHGRNTVHPSGSSLALDELRGSAMAAPRADPPSSAKEEEVAAADGADADAREASSHERLEETLIEVLLEVRAQARAGGDFSTADMIRERLDALGIEVTDAADGTSRATKRLSRYS